jgi:hypothetical protein
MATCTREAFLAASTNYQTPAISQRQRKGIQIRLLIKELAALGGPDYTSDFETLNQAIAELRGINSEQQAAALTQVYAENAAEAGAEVGTVNELLDESKCYICTQDDIDLFLLYLTCQLGVHAAQ